MAEFKVESNTNVMTMESENVLLVKENISTNYENYLSDYDVIKGKWKGSAATVYQTYSENMHNAITCAINSSKMFGENVKTFSDESVKLDDKASANATIE